MMLNDGDIMDDYIGQMMVNDRSHHKSSMSHSEATHISLWSLAMILWCRIKPKPIAPLLDCWKVLAERLTSTAHHHHQLTRQVSLHNNISPRSEGTVAGCGFWTRSWFGESYGLRFGSACGRYNQFDQLNLFGSWFQPLWQILVNQPTIPNVEGNGNWLKPPTSSCLTYC